MIRAVILDIDGTLIDSVDLHARAWQDAFERYGKQVPFDDVRQQIGKGGDQLMPVFFNPEELSEFGEELEEFRGKHYKERYLPHVRPFTHVRELVERIRRHEMKAVLASSAKEEELQHYMKLTEIEDLIESGTSADDVERSKPHPDIFQAALDKLGEVTPDEAIVIGDTPYDAEAAAKCGVRCIGMLCGGFSRRELLDAGCVEIYQSPSNLLAKFDHSLIGRMLKLEHSGIS
jgi:HAD superfamily hydrolase (TIGR01549 family)